MGKAVYMYGLMETEGLMTIVELTAMHSVHTPYQSELWGLMVFPVLLMKCAPQNLSLHMLQMHLETQLW